MGVAKNKEAHLSHVQHMLLQLRESYLAELPQRCEYIENMVLSLKSGQDESVYNEIYRNVHSIKGSAGSHDVHVVSTICHYLEDHLQSLGGGFAGITPEFIDACLAYLDLIRRAIVAEQNGDESDVEQLLNVLQDKAQNQLSNGLLVCSSASINMLCQGATSDLPIKLTLIDNGLAALTRLLQQRFDFLITEGAIKGLNGRALSFALRASDSINRNIPIILLTSADSEAFPQALGPDYVLKKNAQLLHQLNVSVAEIVAG